MTFHEAGHQRSAVGLDYDCAIGDELVRCMSNRLYPSAFNENIGKKNGSTAAIPHSGAPEKNWLHNIYLLANFGVGSKLNVVSLISKVIH
jgi:hypothetical protein